MPEVLLPDGRTLVVPDDATPEQLAAVKAKLARDFPEQAKAAMQKAAPAPQGNAVSRALQSVADPVNRFAANRQVPRPPGQERAPIAPADFPDAAMRIPASMAGGALQFGADLTSNPLKTVGGIAESLATAPMRAITSFASTGPAAAKGDISGVGKGLGDALMAGMEVATVAMPLAKGPMAAASATRAIPKPTQVAVKRLMEADPKLAENAAKAKRFNDAGIPVTTADLTTRNAQSRLKGAARRDGPAQDIAEDAFDPRAADQNARLTSYTEDAFGGTDDFLDRKKAMMDKRKAEAGPRYKEAHATPTNITPELMQLLKRPPLQKAIAQADEIAAIDGLTLNKLGKTGLPIIETNTAAGFKKPYGDTSRLHYMRKAIDDQIEVYRDKATGKLFLDERGSALVGLRKQFNAELRKGNKAFEEADDIWSGGLDAEEAMDKGLKAAGFTSERQVRAFMRDRVKPQDREAFELGFQQGLIEKIGKGGSDMQNRTLKLLGPENQKIIKTVLGEERGTQYLDRVMVENLMSRARNHISPNVGSDTAENLQQSASQAVAIFADVMRGNLASAATGVAKKAGAGKLVEKMQAQQRAVDEQLLRLATEDPDRLISLIQEVSKKQKRFPDVKDIPAGQIAGRTATATALAEIEKDRR